MAQNHTDESYALPDSCEVCGDDLAGNRDYLRHKYAHATKGERPDETAGEDGGPDMAKFTSGFLLVVGGLLCMTLIGAPLGLVMVVVGYWIYKTNDFEFEVAK